MSKDGRPHVQTQLTSTNVLRTQATAGATLCLPQRHSVRVAGAAMPSSGTLLSACVFDARRVSTAVIAHAILLVTELGLEDRATSPPRVPNLVLVNVSTMLHIRTATGCLQGRNSEYRSLMALGYGVLADSKKHMNREPRTNK